MSESRTPRVFISYCREDREPAIALYARLEQLGARPWLDQEKIAAGKRWKREISHAIKESDFFIALLSHKSVNKKGYVQKEIREALEILDSVPDDGAFIIPCRLDDCAPSHDRLLDIQRVDLFPSFEDGLKIIARSIELQYVSPFTTTSRKMRIRDGTNIDGRKATSQIITLSMDDETKAALEELKSTFGERTNASVIRRALALMDTLQREAKDGSSLLLDRHGDRRRLIFPA